MKVEQLLRLDEAERLRIAQQLRREVLLESYYDFFIHFWPEMSAEELVDNWHIRELCDTIQRYGEDVIARRAKKTDLLINVPPGTTKSTIISIGFPAWLWARDPTLRVLSVTYDDKLGTRQAEASRRLIESDKYQGLFGDTVVLSRTERAKDLYSTTAGGFRMTQSTASNVTGAHAHIILIDDPSNPEVALSKAKSARVVRFINKQLNSRKIDKKNTPTVMLMQRLAMNDPAGVWLSEAKEQGRKLEHVCLPAKCQGRKVLPERLRDKYIDGYLDPVRLSQEVLDAERQTLGSVDYSAQYDQDPKTAEGNLFRYSWIKYINPWEVPRGIIWDLWVDGAYTAQSSNSPTGLEVWGYHEATNTAYVRNARDLWLEMPKLLAEIPKIAKEYGLSSKSRIYIEPKASGKSLKQMINEPGFDCPAAAVEIKSHLVAEGKEARAQAASPRFEAGQVVLVAGPWNEDYLDQLCTFPRAENSEHIDLAGYATNHYFGRKPKQRRRRRN